MAWRHCASTPLEHRTDDCITHEPPSAGLAGYFFGRWGGLEGISPFTFRDAGFLAAFFAGALAGLLGFVIFMACSYFFRGSFGGAGGMSPLSLGRLGEGLDGGSVLSGDCGSFVCF